MSASTGPCESVSVSRRAICVAALAGLFARPAAAAQAPALLLAREWPADADPAGYLVSEKFDGVRALWDGRVLLLRGGGEVAAPRWFLDRLPAAPLDGELWLGRSRFEAVAGLIKRLQPDHAAWRALQYQVFELPAVGGRFDDRAQALERLCREQAWPQLQAAAQAPVADRVALQRRLDAVIAAGGEGLMLHRADAPQATGRGLWLWKHKPLHDAEAQVLAHLPGQGRLSGRLGALRVRSDAGIEFTIGTGFSDADRAQPPAPGQRISFKHRGFTAAGVPRFASYLRIAGPA